MATSRNLGGTRRQDDEESLGATLADLAFGSPFAIGKITGAVAHAVMGTRPSHAAERGALTFGLSHLEGLFDALEAAGFRRGVGSLQGVRPDISDPQVQHDLSVTAARQPFGTRPADDPAGQGAEGFSIDTPGDRTTAPAPGEPPSPPSPDISGVIGQDVQSGESAGAGSGPGSSDAGGSAAAGEGTGEGSRAKGDAFLVTRRMLRGRDPKGPDRGRITFTVQDGESVIVLPRKTTTRLGMPRIKNLLARLKAGEAA